MGSMAGHDFPRLVVQVQRERWIPNPRVAPAPPRALHLPVPLAGKGKW